MATRYGPKQFAQDLSAMDAANSQTWQELNDSRMCECGALLLKDEVAAVVTPVERVDKFLVMLWLETLFQSVIHNKDHSNHRGYCNLVKRRFRVEMHIGGWSRPQAILLGCSNISKAAKFAAAAIAGNYPAALSSYEAHFGEGKGRMLVERLLADEQAWYALEGTAAILESARLAFENLWHGLEKTKKEA